MPSPFASQPHARMLPRLALLGVLAILGSLACVGKSTAGKLYLFDGTSLSVKAWDDVNAVYTDAQAGTALPAADRTITSTLLTDMETPLGWGGMVVDNSTNKLFLVTEGGVVYRIAKADTQTGALSSASDIVTFYLGTSSDRYASGSVFGQAAIDPSLDTLYVMETSKDGTGSRVWRVPTASTLADDSTVEVAQAFVATGDDWGTGVAAVPGGSVFGLFGGGDTLYDGSDTAYSGPRLRMGSSGAFPVSTTADVLIGSSTLLASPSHHGSLAYDPANSALYVLTQPASTASTTVSAVLVFTKSQFNSGGFDQAPARTLADTQSVLPDLRILSHPHSSDWLLAADYTASSTVVFQGTGESYFYIWKAPSAGGSAVTVTGSGLEIRALAIGGDD